MSKNSTYRFTFDKPIDFKRVYNFLSPFSPVNNFWIPNDSSETYITTSKLETKNTLVIVLHISFDKIFSEKRFYTVTLLGDKIDTFKVTENNIIKLLELFGLM